MVSEWKFGVMKMDGDNLYVFVSVLAHDTNVVLVVHIFFYESFADLTMNSTRWCGLLDSILSCRYRQIANSNQSGPSRQGIPRNLYRRLSDTGRAGPVPGVGDYCRQGGSSPCRHFCRVRIYTQTIAVELIASSSFDSGEI